MRCLIAATALLTVLGPAPCAHARWTEEEARAEVTRVLGVVPGEAVPTASGSEDLMDFANSDRDGRITRVGVSLEGEWLYMYTCKSDGAEYDDQGNLVTPLAVTEDQAKETALAELRRLMGTAFGRVPEWRGRVDRQHFYRLNGSEPVRGDPPRTGLAARAGVTVSLISGEIVSYGQTLPKQVDPIEPKVSSDDAIATALADWGIPEAHFASERTIGGTPGIWQDPYGREVLYWIIPLMARLERKEKDREGKDVTVVTVVGRGYRIDALTGDILGFDSTF